MEPEQLSICGCFAALALAAGARTSEHLRRRWILPSLTVDFAVAHGGFCWSCCWSPTSRTPADVLLPSPSLLEPDQPNPAATVDFAGAAAALEPDQPNPAATVDFAVAAAAALEPDQLNACGNGGFCRRCCWSPRTRPAERLRQRWILPSSGGWLSAAAADRRQPQKKRRWGNLCLLPHTHPLACGGLPPPRKLLRWMAFSRCRR